MDTVRLGLIGLGGIAHHHLGTLPKLKNFQLTAGADVDPAAVAKVVEKHNIKGFDDGVKLLDSGLVDAVIICTPHYQHPMFAMAAFERGIHVLTEKPVAVTAKAAAEVNEAHKKHPKVVYSAMFQQRTSPVWKKVKSMVAAGDVGQIMRVNWIVTNWFRTQSYYDSGGWRATWQGEGGGVLINQCPHNLDLFTWFVGSPSRVQAIVGLGKHHNIEVEDDVTAMLAYDNGATGVFITGTGEAPGTNRLEIVGDNGKLVVDEGKLIFDRNEVPAREFCTTSPERFATPPRSRYVIEPARGDEGHHVITQNFINAILHGEMLIAPGEEGIFGLELGNAMLMSGITGQPVNVPTDRDAFDTLMQKLADDSTFVKKTPAQAKEENLAASFQR
jgi:predicted dehydrogenase